MATPTSCSGSLSRAPQMRRLRSSSSPPTGQRIKQHFCWMHVFVWRVHMHGTSAVSLYCLAPTFFVA
eukprot:16430303-Heterocapsa_arctica.AAC.1